MTAHNLRVRRHTPDGIQVVGFFQTMNKAHTLANKRMRETGNVYWIERRPVLGRGWEIAQELAPEVQSPIEAAISRGKLPKVQDASGRKGQVLSYIRTTREVRVAWLDMEKPGKGEVVAVDQLSMR